MIVRYWQNLGKRDRQAALIGIVAVIGIISIWAWLSLSEAQQATREQIAAKRALFEKQLTRIAEKEIIAKQLEAAQSTLKQLENGTLPGDKPPVAAAELQSALKEMAISVGIDIVGEKALPSVSSGEYHTIPVEVSFITNTQRFRDLLTRIDTGPLNLAVLDFKVQAVSVSTTGEQTVTLKVAGLWRKGARIPTPDIQTPLQDQPVPEPQPQAQPPQPAVPPAQKNQTAEKKP